VYPEQKQSKQIYIAPYVTIDQRGNNEQHVSVDMCPLTCIRIQVACPGYMLLGDMCPGVNAALE